MKNLQKIIALFLVIFFTGIIVTAVSIHTTLNKKIPTQTTKIQKDSLLLIKAEKKVVERKPNIFLVSNFLFQLEIVNNEY